MSEITIGSKSAAINDFDKSLSSKNGEEKVFIGREDKSISIIKDDSITQILKQATALIHVNGYIRIPILTGEIIIQWGSINVQANNSATGSFPIAFPNSCFQIIGSHRDNDPITSLSIISISASQFTATIAGGASGENISWIAVGN